MKESLNIQISKYLRYALALALLCTLLTSTLTLQNMLSGTSTSAVLPSLITVLTLTYAWCVWVVRKSSLTGMSAEEEMEYQVDAFNHHSMVTIANKDNQITYVNDKFIEVTGYNRDDLLGELTMVFYPESGLELNREINDTLLEGKNWAGETPLRGKDNREIWTHLTIVPKLDKNGLLLGSIAIRTDITQSKVTTAEKNLRRSLHVLRDEVYMFETDTLRYIYLNLAAMKRCGWDKEEYTQKTIIDREIKFNNRDTYDLEAFHRRAAPLIKGDVEEVEHEMIIDGKTHEVKMQLVHPETGKPHFIAIVRDISERRAFEQTKNEFISTVSHELRTPVTSIKGSLGLILSGATGELSSKSKSMLDIAYRNTDRLTLLINDILDLEKIGAGLMEFNCEYVNMGRLISDIISANEAYASKFGVALVGVGVDKKINSFCDSDRVFQIMNNLISNASKFSDYNSQVIITLSQNKNAVCISVEDFGVGIPEDACEDLFERFTQVNSSDRREKGGSGLGLSIVKALVEKLGGKIYFESKVGEGTKFTFELPKNEKTKLNTKKYDIRIAAE